MTLVVERFDEMVRELRRRFPPGLPVRAYLRPIAARHDCVGYSALRYRKGRRSHFVIVIDRHRNRGWFQISDTLAHEWAHLLDWDRPRATGSVHGPRWGRLYARLYRTFVE